MTVLQTLAVANYRSIRSLVMPLGPLNLITGANGSGKSNLYRALRLLAEAAQGGIVSSLAREGGLSSTLWAGPENHFARHEEGTRAGAGRARARSRYTCGWDLRTRHVGYAIDLGLRREIQRRRTRAFAQDPRDQARDRVWAAPTLAPGHDVRASRRGPHVRLRDADGEWNTVGQDLATFESMLCRRCPIRNARPNCSHCARRYAPGASTITSARMPMRPRATSQIGTRTPVLAHDGRDLAAAMQTIARSATRPALNAAVDDAFPRRARRHRTRRRPVHRCCSRSTACCAR